MPRVTCHRKNYKLLDPHVWEVFGGKYNTEHQGYYNGVTETSCDPPRYVLVTDSPENINLPPGSVIVEEERTLEDEFPPHLQGPEVHNILTSKEETIERLWDKVKAYEEEMGALEVEIEQLKIKLKHQKPSGSIRWKLTYTWCDNVTEVYWDFRTKKQAVAFMESNIKGFFGIKIVESIRDIKYDKYIYGTRNVEKNNE
tara:strand:- start:49 stop:645 length:597 start_codon:yes stop_codon:yes gene_type:complete